MNGQSSSHPPHKWSQAFGSYWKNDFTDKRPRWYFSTGWLVSLYLIEWVSLAIWEDLDIKLLLFYIERKPAGTIERMPPGASLWKWSSHSEEEPRDLTPWVGAFNNLSRGPKRSCLKQKLYLLALHTWATASMTTVRNSKTNGCFHFTVRTRDCMHQFIQLHRIQHKQGQCYQSGQAFPLSSKCSFYQENLLKSDMLCVTSNRLKLHFHKVFGVGKSWQSLPLLIVFLWNCHFCPTLVLQVNTVAQTAERGSLDKQHLEPNNHFNIPRLKPSRSNQLFWQIIICQKFLSATTEILVQIAQERLFK